MIEEGAPIQNFLRELRPDDVGLRAEHPAPDNLRRAAACLSKNKSAQIKQSPVVIDAEEVDDILHLFPVILEEHDIVLKDQDVWNTPLHCVFQAGHVRIDTTLVSIMLPGRSIEDDAVQIHLLKFRDGLLISVLSFLEVDAKGQGKPVPDIRHGPGLIIGVQIGSVGSGYNGFQK